MSPAESSYTDIELSSGITSDEEQRAAEKQKQWPKQKITKKKMVQFLSFHRKDSQKNIFLTIRSKEDGSTTAPTSKRLGKKRKEILL